MDSPVRKALKRNDYLRHKLFRKIKRRQRNKVKLDLKIAEKELKRRLRRPKFDGGTDDNKVKVTERTYPDGTVVYFADDGKTLTPINTLDSDDMLNWTWQDMDDPRVTYTGVGNIKDHGEVKQGEGPKSGLGKLHKKLYQVSNKHLQDPIFGAYARFTDSWDNDTNPLKAIWELPATKAAVMELAWAKGLQAANKLKNAAVNYERLGKMAPKELEEFFMSRPDLVRESNRAKLFEAAYSKFADDVVKPKYASAIAAAGREYTPEMEAAISNTPKVYEADFGPYSKWGGYYSTGGGRIMMNSRAAGTDSQLFGRHAHEVHHDYRDLLGLLLKFYPNLDIQTNGESIAQIARSGYTPGEMNALEAYQFTPLKLQLNPDLKPLWEKGATNAEIASRIYYDTGLTGKELNDAIMKMPKSKLIEYLNTNAYGQSFLKSPWTKDKEKAIREALTTVASVMPFGVAYNLKYDGGKEGISDDEYYRIMEDVANLNYKSWGFDNPEDALVSALNDNTYDYRGFYNEFTNSDANAKTHWTDKYKTVYHPTFSEESKYSGNVSDYNPTGMRGGTWSKLRPVYRLSKDQMANNWDVNKTKEYLQREGVDVKTSYDPYMLLERTYKDGTKLYFDEEGQLLNPTTLGLVGGAESYSLPTPTPFADWKWQNTERPELNAHLRLAQYMLNASARDFDNVALGTMGAGIIIPAALTLGLAQLGKFAIDATSGYLFDKAYRLANNRTFAETLYDRYSIPKPIGEFMNPGFFLRGSTKKLYNIIKDRAVGRGFNYRDSYNNINEYLKSMQDVKRNAIDRQSHYFVKPSLEEKNAFGYRYNKYAENITANLDLYNYVNKLLTDDKTYHRIANLFEHNPEYAIHCLQNNILNPLSQDAVNGFIERQLTSIRGVTAENTKDAIRNLTETRLGERLSGGDALNTNGGLYASNNPTVADRFKNPDGGDKAGNGYVGILREDYTNDPTATIELLLKKLRSRIQLERNSSPFAGTGYLLPKDDNVIAYEDVYVGRADLGTGGHERGYLPVKKRPVNIKHITEYKNLADQHGRFALDVKADVLPNLFLHRLLNRYDDYIKYARAFLKGKRVKDFDKASQIAKEFDENTTTRANKARDIISKRVDTIDRINKSVGRLLEFSQGYLVLPLGLSIMINDAAKRGSDNMIDDALRRNIINEYGQLNYQLYDQYDNKDELYRALRRLSNGGWYNIYTGEPYKYNSGKDIHIKPSRRGTFTAAAKKHGMSVQAYARKVLKAPKGKYSSAMRKKANFARNAAKFRH